MHCPPYPARRRGWPPSAGCPPARAFPDRSRRHCRCPSLRTCSWAPGSPTDTCAHPCHALPAPTPLRWAAARQPTRSRCALAPNLYRLPAGCPDCGCCPANRAVVRRLRLAGTRGIAHWLPRCGRSRTRQGGPVLRLLIPPGRWVAVATAHQKLASRHVNHDRSIRLTHLCLGSDLRRRRSQWCRCGRRRGK